MNMTSYPPWTRLLVDALTSQLVDKTTRCQASSLTKLLVDDTTFWKANSWTRQLVDVLTSQLLHKTIRGQASLLTRQLVDKLTSQLVDEITRWQDYTISRSADPPSHVTSCPPWTWGRRRGQGRPGWPSARWTRRLRRKAWTRPHRWRAAEQANPRPLSTESSGVWSYWARRDHSQFGDLCIIETQ